MSSDNQIPVSSVAPVIHKCPKCKCFTLYTGLLHLVEFRKNGPVRFPARACPTCNEWVIPRVEEP